MQKIVTVGLQSYNCKHGKVEEHLTEYLSAGWQVESIQMTTVASKVESSHADVWLVVLLSDKPHPRPRRPD
jgi:hypothetical protein